MLFSLICSISCTGSPASEHLRRPYTNHPVRVWGSGLVHAHPMRAELPGVLAAVCSSAIFAVIAMLGFMLQIPWSSYFFSVCLQLQVFIWNSKRLSKASQQKTMCRSFLQLPSMCLTFLTAQKQCLFIFFGFTGHCSSVDRCRTAQLQQNQNMCFPPGNTQMKRFKSLPLSLFSSLLSFSFPSRLAHQLPLALSRSACYSCYSLQAHAVLQPPVQWMDGAPVRWARTFPLVSKGTSFSTAGCQQGKRSFGTRRPRESISLI